MLFPTTLFFQKNLIPTLGLTFGTDQETPKIKFPTPKTQLLTQYLKLGTSIQLTA